VVPKVRDDLLEPSSPVSDFTDDELTAMALSADPSQPLDPDAVPIQVYLASETPLPEWYMAPVTARHSARWQRLVIMAIIGAFILIEAVGLCSTYGQMPLH
jgi:hypothetical protein